MPLLDILFTQRNYKKMEIEEAMRASHGHRVAPSQVGVEPTPGEKPTSPFVQLANLHPPLSAHLPSQLVRDEYLISLLFVS